MPDDGRMVVIPAFLVPLYAFGYRTVQKGLHHFNLHHMPLSYPDGDTLAWCQWCGIRDVIARRPLAPDQPDDLLAGLPAAPRLKLDDLKYSGNTMRRKLRRTATK